jgi:6-phosphogluconolactonase (cycloisomerase 2 family)
MVKSITFDPTGRYAYVVDNVMDSSSNNIYKLSVNSDGVLSNNSSGASTSSDNPTCIALTPNASYAYVACNSEIIAFKILDTGDLTYINKSTNFGQHPIGIAIDPTGQYLYTAICDSKDVYGFKINSDGTLVKINDTGTILTGDEPNAVAIVKVTGKSN